jgi:hypothetical protein
MFWQRAAIEVRCAAMLTETDSVLAYTRPFRANDKGEQPKCTVRSSRPQPFSFFGR